MARQFQPEICRSIRRHRFFTRKTRLEPNSQLETREDRTCSSASSALVATYAASSATHLGDCGRAETDVVGELTPVFSMELVSITFAGQCLWQGLVDPSVRCRAHQIIKRGGQQAMSRNRSSSRRSQSGKAWQVVEIVVDRRGG